MGRKLTLVGTPVNDSCCVASRTLTQARVCTGFVRGSTMFLNPDHVTIAVADAGPAIDFFALLGFRKEHVLTIDGGPPARYMGMPGMKAQHITLVLEGADPHFEIQLLEFDPTPGTDPGAHPTNLRQR